MTPEQEEKLGTLIELVGLVIAGQRDLLASLKESAKPVIEPTPASFQQFAVIKADTPADELPEVPPAVHPFFGPIGGRSGPGTEGNE